MTSQTLEAQRVAESAVRHGDHENIAIRFGILQIGCTALHYAKWRSYIRSEAHFQVAVTPRML